MPNLMTVLNLDVHQSLADTLNRNRAQRAEIYWKVGRQLNLEYGAPGSSHIPGADMEKLMDLYGVPCTYVTAMRRFADNEESDTVTRARSVIAEYRTWSGIMNRFLRGLAPDALIPAQRAYRGVAAGFVVPEATVEAFAARFNFNHATAQKMMREYAHDTDWLASVFTLRAQRDGHRPVSERVS
jgi:hypothetical protein